MELVPGLIDDLGRRCLIRVSYDDFPAVASVCKSWNAEIQLPDYWRQRKESGLTRPILVLAQAESDPNRETDSEKFSSTPLRYRLTLFDPEADRNGNGGCWRTLPPIPWLPNGLPMFCAVVGVGLELVVIGGLDPDTWKVLDSVYVFDFLSATWRRGADLPGGPRSFFGCAADPLGRKVIVAGGHDEGKNALRSAAVYDVSKDEWAALPDMARERDECKAVFHRGSFLVISGYSSDRQGRFDRGAESFDAAAGRWVPTDEGFSGDAEYCAKEGRGDGDGEMYSCRDGTVSVRRGERWETVAAVPADARVCRSLRARSGKVFVIGSSGFVDPYRACTLDLRTREWSEVDAAKEYRGHVQSACVLEL